LGRKRVYGRRYRKKLADRSVRNYNATMTATFVSGRAESLLVTKSNALFLIAAVLLSIFISSSCNVVQKEGFGIYLADSGELVLSERDIKAFHRADSTFELNGNGIKKWNSYLIYQTVPKLADSLFSRDFVLKIEGQEICRGKFWSSASSASYSGVVILDALFKLDSSHNILRIESGYPGSYMGSLDATISSELIRFFERHNLLK
jgi:hypothetical protein